uniref:1,6-anhydro-N-acetylmuramyl-L-alanine amidase AmpD n=1 Tax=Thaumasiovibrio occultus TaxID=1891184 RepID=UPI000B3610A3|nr:1,6-anhydro-N-acetylmuramyl-L-alanine amidase AmpD [Thaumasiovibrio occultus]
MYIDAAHWLHPAEHIPSPFHNQRDDPADISLLVVHNISLPPNQFGGPYIEQLFTGKLDPNVHPYFAEIHHLQVSSHLLIRRDGEVIQFVPFDKRAWHAGVSEFEGRDKCNDYSIGIELEGTDFHQFTDEQYLKLTQITQLLTKHYPAITFDRITGHQFIAPGRKTDPGVCFDWFRYFSQLK